MAPEIRLKKQIYKIKNGTSNKINIWNYLISHPCVDCGKQNPLFLTFDHLEKKEFNISEAIYRYTWKRILREIAKCVVRCFDCHFFKTAKEGEFWSFKYFEKYGQSRISDSETKRLLEEAEKIELELKLSSLDSKPDERAGTVLKTDGT